MSNIKAKTHARLYSHQEIKPLVFAYLLYHEG
jgi:hypothetical protein